MQQLEKTIILVGATGSGKSTLVDGMVNYIYGVNWDNEFRFHIVELEEKETGKQKSKVRIEMLAGLCYMYMSKYFRTF